MATPPALSAQELDAASAAMAIAVDTQNHIEEALAAEKIQSRIRGRQGRKLFFKAKCKLRSISRFDYYRSVGVSDEELAQIRACFNRYNVDNDATISSRELRNAIYDMDYNNGETEDGKQTSLSVAELMKLFKSIDQNG
jgi:hypothetical protein